MKRTRIALPALGLILVIAGIAAGGGLAASRHHSPRAERRSHDADHRSRHTAKIGPLPVKQMEAALQVKGEVQSGGVLSAEVDRNDIGTVSLDSPSGAVPAKPSWEINGNLTFQPLAHGKAFFNGDMALKSSEVDPFISAIFKNHLVFQAEHMHMYDFNPIVWFIHWRGVGSPVQLAERVHNVLKATSVPLPQAPPPHPTTPFNVKLLKKELHASSATIGSDGVVTFEVDRRNATYINGIKVDNSTNIATNIGFEPLNSTGTEAAVMPDFAMTGGEIDRVVSLMRGLGWDIGCLYNQETQEHPQLYFSHEFKAGNPYALALEIRQALNRTNSK